MAGSPENVNFSKALRDAAEITTASGSKFTIKQNELADALGISPANLSEMMRGKSLPRHLDSFLETLFIGILGLSEEEAVKKAAELGVAFLKDVVESRLGKSPFGEKVLEEIHIQMCRDRRE